MTQLIVALDTPASVGLIPALNTAGVTFFKLDTRLMFYPKFFEHAVKLLKDLNCDIFLDLKLYGTYDTVYDTALKAFSSLKTRFLTVFATTKMLEAATNAKPLDNDYHKVLAVGPLTDGSGHFDCLMQYLSLKDGIICPSVTFADSVRDKYKGFLILPGIRYGDNLVNNHINTTTPKQAKDAGVDFIVVGRPIINSIVPIEVASAIIRNLS